MFLNNLFLVFSDSAKFAGIAKNLVNGLGYGDSFCFWGPSIFKNIQESIFYTPWIPPVMPYSIATFYKMFGVSDFAVIATSVFYFILTLIFVFLLGRKVFKSNLVGIFSTLAVGFNKDLINYAMSGASESPFIFEIVAASYFISLKNRWGNVVTFLLLVATYFTRPQAFIYIAGIILYWFLINLKTKKALIYFAGILIAGLLIDYFLLPLFAGRNFLYSITRRGINAVTQIVSGGSASDSLRGEVVESIGIVIVSKKIFYNLYNFFKLLPQIMSPYLFVFFVLGLFMKSKDKVLSSYKIAAVFMFVVTLLVTAASIPFFRYIHPIVPLIYVVAIGIMVKILKQYVLKHKCLVLMSLVMIFLFGVGQTFGALILDSRFERNTHNVDKAPVYVELSKILKDNTEFNDIVVTNLDTWGSWYGERKTVWFPLEPDQLIPPEGQLNPFDAIYLTSYLMDDENYYMGEEWRQIFYNPENPENEYIAENYKLKEIIEIDGKEVYEKQDARAVLLVKKSN